ncbi:MAG: type II toxin-antitoxin system RelE/ParE family toxin [Chloroflexi bacterium]|nr:type II toxin-antitoxin system RelE/ParE family toxin [Chloroflexota bacterium]
MAYRIRFARPAIAGANAAFEHIREVAPLTAERWLHGLFAAIQTLEQMPSRCPVIPEAEELGHLARHLIYGQRASAYRIIFDVQEESEEGRRVRVFRVWHGARDAVIAADIADLETEH